MWASPLPATNNEFRIDLKKTADRNIRSFFMPRLNGFLFLFKYFLFQSHLCLSFGCQYYLDVITRDETSIKANDKVIEFYIDLLTQFSSLNPTRNQIRNYGERIVHRDCQVRLESREDGIMGEPISCL